jgi:hypothetical protein
MKRNIFLIAFLLTIFSVQEINAQIISESAKRKVTVGVDFFTDIWLNQPDKMETRTVNQGANVFMQYNFLLNETGTVSFGIGPGIMNHNLYSNSKIQDVKGDSIIFKPIIQNYRRSKVNVVYFYIPMDVKLRFKNDIKLTIGFNFGFTIDSKQKYFGDRPIDNIRVMEKQKKIEHLDKYTYGPTFRFGWKYITIYGSYQINGIFEKGYGTDNLNPISVGITLTPF